MCLYFGWKMLYCIPIRNQSQRTIAKFSDHIALAALHQVKERWEAIPPPPLSIYLYFFTYSYVLCFLRGEGARLLLLLVSALPLFGYFFFVLLLLLRLLVLLPCSSFPASPLVLWLFKTRTRSFVLSLRNATPFSTSLPKSREVQGGRSRETEITVVNAVHRQWRQSAAAIQWRAHVITVLRAASTVLRGRNSSGSSHRHTVSQRSHLHCQLTTIAVKDPVVVLHIRIHILYKRTTPYNVPFLFHYCPLYCLLSSSEM